MDFAPEIIEKVKAAHPGVELHLLTVESKHADRVYQAIAKVPNRDRWMRFKAQLRDDTRKAVAFEGLVRDMVVHPDPQALDSLLEQRPALAESFGGQISELAGLEEKVHARKL